MGTWEEQNKQVFQKKQAWIEEKPFDFHSVLLKAKNEEEVKAAYIREFSLPVNMQERHDLKVEKALFEFKYSVDFSDIETSSRIVSQAIYYIRRLYVKERMDEISHLIVADKDEVKIFRISDLEIFYTSENYNWDEFRPSSPDPYLVNAVRESNIIESNRTYKILEKNDLEIFGNILYQIVFSSERPKDTIVISKKNNSSNLILLTFGICIALMISLLFFGQIHKIDFPVDLSPEKSSSKGDL
jgi:hypothetical protein